MNFEIWLWHVVTVLQPLKSPEKIKHQEIQSPSQRILNDAWIGLMHFYSIQKNELNQFSN